MKSRALRRHNREKKKEMWKRRFRSKLRNESYPPLTNDEIEAQASDPKKIGKAVSVHGSFCSCPMCGNPRRHFHEKTQQEKLADQKEKDEE